MKTNWMILLSALVSTTAFASPRVSQYCSGKASINGQTQSVTYYDGCGMDAQPCFVNIAIGEEQKNLSLHSGAKIQVHPASESEVVIAESAKEELLVVLQRTGKLGTLTFLNDQNKILSNLPVRCTENDDI